MVTDNTNRSPKRRSSIAVPNQNQPSIVPRGRRRAHSIVPGAKLSPLAKARRALAPRKSILKASVNSLNVHQSSQQSSQSTVNDDTNATASMEMTQDYTELVRDNQTRKSFGRRVSFAEHSSVRLFPRARPSDASTISSSGASPDQPLPPQQSNENDYPRQNNRRRSSVRYSMAGSEDMDMTTVIAAPFQMPGSAILDEEFDYEDEEEEFDDGEDMDMDVTQAIQGGFARKRSLSMAGRRQSQLPAETEEGDQSRSEVGNESMQSFQSEGNSELSQPMEFTVPLGQSLRPAQQDDAWLALKQMTHSGDEPAEHETSYEEDTSRADDGEMQLDDAMARLRRARDSFSLGATATAQQDEPQDDSFTSEEDSLDMDDDIDDGNKTLNLSTMLGRPSMGGASRMSMGYESNMDESEVYGNIVASRLSLAPNFQSSRTATPAEAPEAASTTAPKPRPSLVFQPPPANVSTPAALDQPRKSTVTFSAAPNPPSPSKASNPSISTPSKQKPKPTFSAAFAPPVSKPSPKKPSATVAGSELPPAKRPRGSTVEESDASYIDQPSPAKRQALASTENTNDSSNANAAVKPSPAKKLGFQPRASIASATVQPQAESAARSSSLRRPSGYFAKRKSLAVTFNVEPDDAGAPSAVVNPPKKTFGIGKGRASMGSASTDAWKRFDKTAPAPASELASAAGKAPSLKGKEVEVIEEEGEDVVETETEPEPVRQASASPRASPAPMDIEEANEHDVIPEIREPAPEDDAPAEDNNEADPELSGDMNVDNAATQQWRQGVEQEYEEQEEVPSISVAQFFSITGIKFMDELTAPRRSIHPGQAPIQQPRNPADIPLSEYVIAMAIDIPQLDLYSRVAKDLEAWMAKSKVVFAQAEEEAAIVTPELFVEYARADEEGQAELLHQLNLIRTHTRYMARSDWYDWKLQWVEGLRVTAEEAFASLEKDARALEEPKKTALELIPELEKEYEELMRELEQEQAEVAEIEGSDQDYLNELKATIAEQNIEIEALKAELKEGDDQVRWLADRLSEIEIQKREAKNTISTAERVLRTKQTSTRSEVFRLKAELEALEDLNIFRITRVGPDLFEYIYSSLFQVSIPCTNFIPHIGKIKITRSGKRHTRYKDDFPRLSNFLLSMATQVLSEDEDTTVRAIVHRLSAYWSSCAQLRTQLTILSVKYPVEIILPATTKDTPMQPTFRAQAAVMFPKVMGKARISFVFSFDTFSQWPITINTLDCDVEVAYGAIDRDTILKAVVERTSQASAFENFACLLDACILAQDIYH